MKKRLLAIFFVFSMIFNLSFAASAEDETVIKILAEDRIETNDTNGYVNNTHPDTGEKDKIIPFNRNDYYVFEVTIPKTGNYTINMRCGVHNTLPLKIQVSTLEGSVYTVLLEKQLNGTGGYTRIGNQDVGTLKLNAGTQKIKLLNTYSDGYFAGFTLEFVSELSSNNNIQLSNSFFMSGLKMLEQTGSIYNFTAVRGFAKYVIGARKAHSNATVYNAIVPDLEQTTIEMATYSNGWSTSVVSSDIIYGKPVYVVFKVVAENGDAAYYRCMIELAPMYYKTYEAKEDMCYDVSEFGEGKYVILLNAVCYNNVNLSIVIDGITVIDGVQFTVEDGDYQDLEERPFGVFEFSGNQKELKIVKNGSQGGIDITSFKITLYNDLEIYSINDNLLSDSVCYARGTDTFIIRTNAEIDLKTVDEESVALKDEEGNILQTEVSASENIITMVLKETLDYDSSYKLCIDGIKSSRGEGLLSPFEYDIITSDVENDDGYSWISETVTEFNREKIKISGTVSGSQGQGIRGRYVDVYFINSHGDLYTEPIASVISRADGSFEFLYNMQEEGEYTLLLRCEYMDEDDYTEIRGEYFSEEFVREFLVNLATARNSDGVRELFEEYENVLGLDIEENLKDIIDKDSFYQHFIGAEFESTVDFYNYYNKVIIVESINQACSTIEIEKIFSVEENIELMGISELYESLSDEEKREFLNEMLAMEDVSAIDEFDKKVHIVLTVLLGNKIEISGDFSGTIGESGIKKKVHIKTNKEANYFMCILKYPSDIILDEIIRKDFEYVSEESRITANGVTTLTLVCQYANSGDIPQQTDIEAFELSFSVAQNAELGIAKIEVCKASALIGDEDYTFDKIIDDILEIKPKFEIVGPDTILTDTAYYTRMLPDYIENKAVIWSVDDETVATVSEDGVVTPLKNGTFVLTAEATDGSGIFATKTINTIVYAKLDSVVSDRGAWDKQFDGSLSDYTIYVEDEVEGVNITPSFSGGGVLMYNNSVIMINNRAKYVPLTEKTTVITLDRGRVTGKEDFSYTITIIKDTRKMESMVRTSTTVQKVGENAIFTVSGINLDNGCVVCVATYKEGRLKGFDFKEYSGEAVELVTYADYVEAKVLVIENLETLRPIAAVEWIE